LRLAKRGEQKVRLGYRDAQGRETTRAVWPIAFGFFDRTRVLVAWCELRQELRHFRTDRIVALARLTSATRGAASCCSASGARPKLRHALSHWN
jgi:predicted DNA-binding transcriptional regulator YafY